MNHALVALTPDGRVSRYSPSRGIWQDTNLRLPKGATGRDITDVVGDSSFFFQNQNRAFVGARLTFGRDDRIGVRYFPDLSRLPLKFEDILAGSPSGQQIVGEQTSNGSIPTALHHSRGRWLSTVGPIDIYGFGDRSAVSIAAYDLSEHWLLIVSNFRVGINTTTSTVHIYDVTRPTDHFVYSPEILGSRILGPVSLVAPTRDGWFVQLDGGDTAVYRIQMHSGRRPAFALYAKGALVGPVLGSDIAIYRDDLPGPGRLLLRGRTIGTPPDGDRNWNPLLFWPEVGALWQKTSNEGKEALSLGKQPVPVPGTRGNTQYFLLSQASGGDILL